jgi:hypothetical protein
MQILSGQWVGVYDYIKKGDLVSVGPVHQKKIGIALERKTVSFGYEPDEWHILVDGEVLAYSASYISSFEINVLHDKFYRYNYKLKKEVRDG